MSASLKHSVVAITGGGRGIGRATAAAFLKAGAKVAIGDLDAESAATAAAQMKSIGPSVIGLPLNVTSRDSFAAFLNDAEQKLGALTILVNNAGVMLTGPFLDEAPASEQLMVDLNLGGVITGAKIAGERFATRRNGHIINIASMAGTTGFPGVATYCATKFGVVGLTHALREELQPQGVRVSAILPGIVHTELSAGMKMPGVIEDFVSCEPDDIATAVVRTVETNRLLTFAPRRLELLLRARSVLPETPRRFLSKITGTEYAYLNVDETLRSTYHTRASKAGR